MTILQYIKADAKKVPKTFGYKIEYNILTLEDQEESLKDPYNAYYFAVEVPGADIRRCEEVACKHPEYAYLFAQNVPGADISKCEDAACKDPQYAYYFGAFVPGANKDKCRKAALGIR